MGWGLAARAVGSALALALLAAGALGAGSATAAEDSPRGGAGAFRLAASNGFSAQVLAMIGDSPANGRVAVLFERGGRSVTYGARATVTLTSIEADLGARGRIDVEFVPSGVTETARSSCGGKVVEYPGGEYVGTIDVHGERGFAAVRAGRAAYTPQFWLDAVCVGPLGSELVAPEDPGATLRLTTRSRGGRLGLRLTKRHRRARASYEATIEERRGELWIGRGVRGRLPARSFSFGGDSLRRASIRPPAPFSGAARFRRGAIPVNRWTGDLAIDFPGRPGVSLTGRDVRASLRHGVGR